MPAPVPPTGRRRYLRYLARSFRTMPVSLAAAMVLLFGLLLAVSTDSRWQRVEDGFAATQHHVRLGVLSWAEVQAVRPTTDGPWTVSTSLNSLAALWTLLLSAPAAWWWYASAARWRQRLQA